LKLDGEIAIVTGAARGLGAEIARALAGAGAAVAVTARREKAARVVADEIAAAGGKAIGIACDVADRASVERAVAEVRERLGPATILINNAGVIEPLGTLHETELEAFSANIAVNLVGAAATAQAVLPGMLAAGHGTIVNISSGAARSAFAGWGAYCVAKAGLAMLGKVLAAEYGDKGIRVFGFAPGIVDTDMQTTIRAAGIGPTASLPRERLAHPRVPAAAVVFLCSGASDRFAGKEVDIRSPNFRAAAGLKPLPL
jgi:NAD(P)-dependent dehydrogenase (short-subunit alcohol dehydrogenase family)